MNKWNRAITFFIISDWLACLFAWFVFFMYRKKVETAKLNLEDYAADPKLILGLVIIPLCWLLLFWFAGNYHQVYRKTRIGLFSETITPIFFGSLTILFAVIIDDISLGYISYFQSFLAVFIIHFVILFFSRNWLLTFCFRQLKKGGVFFETLLIWDRPRHSKVKLVIPGPFRIVRKISLSELSEVAGLIDPLHISDVIIDISDRDAAMNAIQSLGWHWSDLKVILTDKTYQGIKGFLKVRPTINDSGVELKTRSLSPFQDNVKRILDITVSLFALILLTPLILFIAFKVKASSPGKIIFKQSRVGRKGKVFTIRKFRSMYENAEKNGPMLTRDDDERCTGWGKKMRKWRMDEIPQFWNVIKGEMSLVGPRPERAFYIQRIKERVPNYDKILQVNPGITSWGQIKYGYASSIPEMIQRLRYDMLYIDNRSLVLDFKILIYTIAVLIQGRGK